jgi:hypothetical protein
MSLVREHRTGRLHTLNVPLAANAGCPTGGDSYGHGPPIVVRDGNAVHRAKGQPSKEGQSLPGYREAGEISPSSTPRRDA